MKTKTTKLIVKPEEFGLDAKTAEKVALDFAPKISERTILIAQYDEVIKLDVDDPETSKKARELRLKVVKNRTGIQAVHKKLKAFSNAYGKFVDAWRNKEVEVDQQMEEKLLAIEKIEETKQAQKIADLQAKRHAEVIKYSEIIPLTLGEMSQEMFDTYLSGLKFQAEQKKIAEQTAADLAAEKAKSIALQAQLDALKTKPDTEVTVNTPDGDAFVAKPVPAEYKHGEGGIVEGHGVIGEEGSQVAQTPRPHPMNTLVEKLDLVEVLPEKEAFHKLLAQMNDMQLGIGFGRDGEPFTQEPFVAGFNNIKNNLNNMINYYYELTQ